MLPTQVGVDPSKCWRGCTSKRAPHAGGGGGVTPSVGRARHSRVNVASATDLRGQFGVVYYVPRHCGAPQAPTAWGLGFVALASWGEKQAWTDPCKRENRAISGAAILCSPRRWVGTSTGHGGGAGHAVLPTPVGGDQHRSRRWSWPWWVGSSTSFAHYPFDCQGRDARPAFSSLPFSNRSLGKGSSQGLPYPARCCDAV